MLTSVCDIEMSWSWLLSCSLTGATTEALWTWCTFVMGELPSGPAYLPFVLVLQCVLLFRASVASVELTMCCC